MTRKEAGRKSAKTSPETGAPAGRNGSAGAFKFQALMSCFWAAEKLWRINSVDDVAWAVNEGLPDVALRRIERAEAELRRAKKALTAWQRSK